MSGEVRVRRSTRVHHPRGPHKFTVLRGRKTIGHVYRIWASNYLAFLWPVKPVLHLRKSLGEWVDEGQPSRDVRTVAAGVRWIVDHAR